MKNISKLNYSLLLLNLLPLIMFIPLISKITLLNIACLLLIPIISIVNYFIAKRKSILILCETFLSLATFSYYYFELSKHFDEDEAGLLSKVFLIFITTYIFLTFATTIVIRFRSDYIKHRTTSNSKSFVKVIKICVISALNILPSLTVLLFCNNSIYYYYQYVTIAIPLLVFSMIIINSVFFQKIYVSLIFDLLAVILYSLSLIYIGLVWEIQNTDYLSYVGPSYLYYFFLIIINIISIFLITISISIKFIRQKNNKNVIV